jgi:Icc-related predicted phosphoesterase
MIVDCISDMHGEFPELEGGNLLLIAGDCTSNDKVKAWGNFFDWLDKQEYDRKIMIAGNHDNFCEQWIKSNDSIYDELVGRPTVTYLCDSGTEYEFKGNKYKIWGSPWTAQFKGINPHCCAFTIPFDDNTERRLSEEWDMIPDDTDILITHCPPYDMFDLTFRGQKVGSPSLLARTLDVAPLLHLFGHIHEQGGKKFTFERSEDKNDTIFVNASIVNEEYDPVNKPVRIIL